MWPFRRRRKQDGVEGNGLTEARKARIAAEERLSQTRRDVVHPLTKLREDNHIGALIEDLIARRAQEQK